MHVDVGTLKVFFHANIALKGTKVLHWFWAFGYWSVIINEL